MGPVIFKVLTRVPFILTFLEHFSAQFPKSAENFAPVWIPSRNYESVSVEQEHDLRSSATDIFWYWT
jgi:hypothetical protein